MFGISGLRLVARVADLSRAWMWREGTGHTGSCEWLSVEDCITHHYPGAWPAFIAEQVEK